MLQALESVRNHFESAEKMMADFGAWPMPKASVVREVHFALGMAEEITPDNAVVITGQWSVLL